MWVNSKILIYRKDLIPENKVPKTWEEYQKLSQELSTDEMYGTTVFGSGTDAVCSFLDFACQAGADGLVFDKEGNVNADTYLADEEGYTNAANTLKIAAADDTKIVDKDEKEYKGDLDKNDLIVFYGVSTKSIPAQTTPTKVVVLGENEIALKQD